MSRIAGVVPAAGASRRMGRPKALLHLDGEPFLRRAVRALAEGGCSPVFVVVREDDAAAASVARRAGARVIRNPTPGDGPITSIRMAVRLFGRSLTGFVLLPLDHALVEPRHVRRLLAEAEEADAPLVLPVHDGERGHPVLFRRPLFDELLAPDLEEGARTVVHRCLDRAHTYASDDPAILTDIDTPEEYEATRREWERERAESPPHQP